MPDGRVRQLGRFERKRDAQRAIAVELERLDESPAERRARMTVREFLAIWPEQFPRRPRTTQTNLRADQPLRHSAPAPARTPAVFRTSVARS
jgi:hypothetical protein